VADLNREASWRRRLLRLLLLLLSASGPSRQDEQQARARKAPGRPHPAPRAAKA